MTKIGRVKKKSSRYSDHVLGLVIFIVAVQHSRPDKVTYFIHLNIQPTLGNEDNVHGISQAIVEQVQPTDFVSRRCVHGRLPPRTPSGFPSVI